MRCVVAACLAGLSIVSAAGEGNVQQLNAERPKTEFTFQLRDQKTGPFAHKPVTVRQLAGVTCTGTQTEDLGDSHRLVTDDAGTVTFEGYHGDHQITLDGHVWKVRFAKGESTEVTLTFVLLPA